MHTYFNDSDIKMLTILLIIFVPVFIMLIYSAFTKKKIGNNPKILNVATLTPLNKQDEIYVAIRQGIDECTNMHDMQDYYRAIQFYKKDFPDKESQQDAIILLQAYNDKGTRLLSNFRSNY